MAHVEVSALSKQQKDELVCTYAALMLHDGDLEITEEKLKKVITASGNSVEGYWPGLFAKALKGKNVAEMLSNAGNSSAAAAPATAAPAQAAAPAKKEEPKSKYTLSISLVTQPSTVRTQLLHRIFPLERGKACYHES
jgi:large subunit ribosomal protein LP1